MPRYKWGNAVLVILSLVLSLVLAEIVCRLMLPPPGFIPRGIGEPAGLLREHATRGFSYALNFSGSMKTADFSTEIRIGVNGFRDIPAPPASDGRPIRRILAVGDSMTFGWGVEAEESWPARLQSHLNSGTNVAQLVSVTNAGISAYSLAQISILTKEVLAEQEVDMVILGLLPAVFGRIEDPYVLFNGLKVMQSSLPFLKPQGDGFLLTEMRRNSLKTLDFWLDEYFWFGSHLLKLSYRVLEFPKWGSSVEPVAEVQRRRQEQDEKRFQVFLLELESLAKFVKERQIPFVVLLTLTQDKDGTINERQRRYNAAVIEFCKEKQIEAVDLLPILATQSGERPFFRFPKDAHWTAPAHDIAARELASYLRKNRSALGQYAGESVPK